MEVALVREGAGYRVTRVEPVAWRSPASPPPLASLAPELRAIQERLGGTSYPASVELAEERARLRIDAARRWTVVFGGVAFVQLALELDVAGISAFPLEPFRQTPAAATWPRAEAFPSGLVVFRIEPEQFGSAAAYVVARHVGLED